MESTGLVVFITPSSQKHQDFVTSTIVCLLSYNCWRLSKEFSTLISIFIMEMVLKKLSTQLTELWQFHSTNMENISQVRCSMIISKTLFKIFHFFYLRYPITIKRNKSWGTWIIMQVEETAAMQKTSILESLYHKCHEMIVKIECKLMFCHLSIH